MDIYIFNQIPCMSIYVFNELFFIIFFITVHCIELKYLLRYYNKFKCNNIKQYYGYIYI